MEIERKKEVSRIKNQHSSRIFFTRKIEEENSASVELTKQCFRAGEREISSSHVQKPRGEEF